MTNEEILEAFEMLEEDIVTLDMRTQPEVLDKIRDDQDALRQNLKNFAELATENKLAIEELQKAQEPATDHTRELVLGVINENVMFTPPPATNYDKGFHDALTMIKKELM